MDTAPVEPPLLTACRYKGTRGNEFLAVVDDTTAEKVEEAIDQLGKRCSQVGHALPGSDARISPSDAMDHAVRHGHQDSPDEATAVADKRMYTSKALAKKRRANDA